MIRRYAIGLGLCVTTVVLLGGLAWQQSRPASKSVKSTLAVVQCTGVKSSDFDCQKLHYQTLTQLKGVAAAFVDLKAAYAVDASIQSNCHQLTHVIGREAGTIYGDVGKAYENGDNFCWSGYYHGVMESIAAKVGEQNLSKEANNICASVAADKGRYSFFHFNCVHGMGHGFMALTGDELFVSLKDCDYLTDPWEAESCYGGVFMENIMTEFNSAHHSNYLKADQPLYPCTAVEDKYKTPCYLMQTSHALKLMNYDFTKVFSICGGVAETSYRQTCYQSLGRDASGNSNSNQVQTKASCELGQNAEAQQNCIIGAVKDFISYYHSDKQGLALCQSLSADLNSVCTETARTYYKSF